MDSKKTIKPGVIEGEAPTLKALDAERNEKTNEARGEINVAQEQRKAAQEQREQADSEILDRLVPVGDKVLVRILEQDQLQQTEGGLFLPTEYSANTLDRCALLAVGQVSDQNHFAQPIIKKLLVEMQELMQIARLHKEAPRPLEILVSKRRQDAHEYRYRDQTYLLVPAVFVVAICPKTPTIPA